MVRQRNFFSLTQAIGSMATNGSVQMGTCISLFYCRIDINGEVIFWRCRWRIVWMDLRIGPGQWLVNGSMLISTKNNNLHARHTQWWPFTVEMVQCITASKRNVFSLPTSGCFWGFYNKIFNAYTCHKQCGRKKLLTLSKKKLVYSKMPL